MIQYFTWHYLCPARKLSLENPSFWVNLPLVQNAIYFSTHMEFIVKKEKHSPGNYIPHAQKEVILFIYRKIIWTLAWFQSARGRFHWNCGIGIYIYSLRLDVITVFECCVIKNLHYIYLQHRINHNWYAARTILHKYFMLPFGSIK